MTAGIRDSPNVTRHERGQFLPAGDFTGEEKSGNDTVVVLLEDNDIVFCATNRIQYLITLNLSM